MRDAYCVKTNATQYTQYDIRKTQYELWYPFVGEFARLIKEHSPVYVSHHLLPINANNALMPSISFGPGLTRLVPKTTTKR